MKPLWKKLLGVALKARELVVPKCPICQAPMYRVPNTKNSLCENGHLREGP